MADKRVYIADKATLDSFIKGHVLEEIIPIDISVETNFVGYDDIEVLCKNENINGVAMSYRKITDYLILGTNNSDYLKIYQRAVVEGKAVNFLFTGKAQKYKSNSWVEFKDTSMGIYLKKNRYRCKNCVYGR